MVRVFIKIVHNTVGVKMGKRGDFLNHNVAWDIVFLNSLDTYCR